MWKSNKAMTSICLICFICGETSTEKLSHKVDLELFGDFLRQYCLLRKQSKVLIYADLKSGWWSTELSNGWIYLVKYLISNDISITVIDLPSHGYQKLPILANPPGGFATLTAVLYDGSSTAVGALLKRFSDLRFFRSRYNWLILTPVNKLNYLEELLQQLGIYTDSNVHYGVLYASQIIKIWEAYHVALNKPLRINHLGDWSPINIEESSASAARVTVNPEPQIPTSRLWMLRVTKLPYKYVKRSNLEGIRLKAITVGMRQYITDFRRNSKGTLEVTGGFFGEVFKTIMDSINFTYSLAYIPGYSYGKIKELGNNWTGVVGYLASKRADIALCGISESKWRMPVIDLTAPLMFQRSRLFVNSSPSPYQIDLYFRPFTRNLWTFLITCFLLIALFQRISRLLYGIVKTKQVHPHTKTQTNTKEQENTPSRKKAYRHQVIDQDSSSDDASSSARLIILSGSILFTVASTGYSAKLTSIHAVHRFIPEIRNIDDLAKSPDWEMGILNGSWDRWLMKNAPKNSSMGILWKDKIQRKPSHLIKYPIEGLLRVSQNQKYAFLGESLESLLILAGIKVGAIEDNLEKDKGEEFKLEANTQGEEMLPRYAACKIAELPGDVLKIGSSFGLQKYSPIKDIFNYHLIKLWSTGVLQIVKKRFIEPQHTICDGKSVFLPASLGDTFFSVILFGIGVTLSLFILITELALMKIKKEKKLKTKKRKNKKLIPYHH